MKRNILLNPGPATTSDSVKQALLVPDICPREEEFGELMAGICNDLPKIVHGGDEYVSVLFTASGTGGLEAAACSAVPEDGKLLVIENGAYGKRIAGIARTYKIPVVSYELDFESPADPDVVEEMLSSDPGITHLAIVHHETTTGLLNPVEEICRVAGNHDVKVIVDAMSSFAGIPINIREWGADYLVSSSNKCIQGMPGLVFVIFKKELLESIKANRRSYYLDMYSQYTGFNHTGQMPFTPPVQVVYALRKAMDEYFEEGEQGRWGRYQKNWEILYEEMGKLGFRFLIREEYQSHILMAVLDPVDENYSFNDMHNYLYERGFTIYPGKGASESTFRLAIIGDLYPEDIQAFIEAMKGYVKERGLRVS